MLCAECILCSRHNIFAAFSSPRRAPLYLSLSCLFLIFRNSINLSSLTVLFLYIHTQHTLTLSTICYVKEKKERTQQKINSTFFSYSACLPVRRSISPSSTNVVAADVVFFSLPPPSYCLACRVRKDAFLYIFYLRTTVICHAVRMLMIIYISHCIPCFCSEFFYK